MLPDATACLAISFIAAFALENILHWRRESCHPRLVYLLHVMRGRFPAVITQSAINAWEGEGGSVLLPPMPNKRKLPRTPAFFECNDDEDDMGSTVAGWFRRKFQFIKEFTRAMTQLVRGKLADVRAHFGGSRTRHWASADRQLACSRGRKPHRKKAA
jgi:hypothetical protein